jgi:hypothetical protein
MGLSKTFGVNPLSFSEKKKILVFPTSISDQIPLYLKFNCVEYSQNGLFRAGSVVNAGGYGNVKAVIAVPMPSKLTTQTAMRYKQEENPNVIPSGNILLREGSDKLGKLGNSGLLKLAGISDAKSIAAGAVSAIGSAAMQKSQMIDSDFHETILQSGSKRSFQVQLYMPCLNAADSIAAAEIISAFEALALPTSFGETIGGTNLGFQFFFHPPMWFISAGALDDIKSDRSWTSQPQASVLTNVAVLRTAIDASSFTALDGNIKPVAYSVTLNFVEIEAAIRTPSVGGGTSFTIKNRSAAANQGQSALVAAATN